MARARSGEASGHLLTEFWEVLRAYHKWWSPRLERDMELLVFGHAGTRVLVFPTRCGRFYDYEGFGILQALAPRIEAGHLQLYCLDSIDQESFYCFWAPPWDRMRRHQAYEDYILYEVVPLSHQLNPGMPLMTHGCSLGGYHAVNLALRHPSYFVKAVSLSGRFDLTQGVDDFRDLLDGHRDDHVFYHTPNAYLSHAHDPGHLDALRGVEVVLAVGQHDPFLGQNHYLASVLGRQGMCHALYVWGGRGHSPRTWMRMAALYV